MMGRRRLIGIQTMFINDKVKMRFGLGSIQRDLFRRLIWGDRFWGNRCVSNLGGGGSRRDLTLLHFRVIGFLLVGKAFIAIYIPSLLNFFKQSLIQICHLEAAIQRLCTHVREMHQLPPASERKCAIIGV